MTFVSKRRLISALIPLGIIMAFFIYDARKPKGVSAEGCITIMPTINYGVASGSSPGGCASKPVFAPYPGTGNPWVALTGWEVNFSSGDAHIDEVKIDLSFPTFSNSGVNFTVTACLNDNSNSDPFTWEARYVVIRWR